MAKNVWNEENTKIVVEAYQAKLESDGKEAAAENDFLKTLAEKVGAPSEKSVRSKLTTAGVYQKPDAVASVAKTNTVRKEHYVRALAHTLGLDLDTLDSLKNAKADSLKAITDKLGITQVMTAAAKDYEISKEDFVHNLMLNLGIDLDEFTTYIEEGKAE